MERVAVGQAPFAQHLLNDRAVQVPLVVVAEQDVASVRGLQHLPERVRGPVLPAPVRALRLIGYESRLPPNLRRRCPAEREEFRDVIIRGILPAVVRGVEIDEIDGTDGFQEPGGGSAKRAAGSGSLPAPGRFDGAEFERAQGVRLHRLHERGVHARGVRDPVGGLDECCDQELGRGFAVGGSAGPAFDPRPDPVDLPSVLGGEVHASVLPAGGPVTRVVLEDEPAAARPLAVPPLLVRPLLIQSLPVQSLPVQPLEQGAVADLPLSVAGRRREERGGIPRGRVELDARDLEGVGRRHQVARMDLPALLLECRRHAGGAGERVARDAGRLLEPVHGLQQEGDEFRFVPEIAHAGEYGDGMRAKSSGVRS